MSRFVFPVIMYSGRYRPLIPIKLINPSTTISINTLCWIDSGSDTCLFPASLASDLGHNLTRGNLLHGQGVGSPRFQSYLHTNDLIISDGLGNIENYRCPTYFSTASYCGLLGLDGFFSHFRVYINYRKRVIVLETY